MASVVEGEDFFSLISVEEKGSIPENLSKKLQDVWELKVKETTNLRVDIEKLKLTSEQEKFQLEKQLVSIQSQLEEAASLKDEFRTQKENLEKKFGKIEDDLQQSRLKVTSLSRELEQFSDWFEEY